MFSLPWPYIVLTSYLIAQGINLLAKWLQWSKLGSEVPEELKDIYDADEYKTFNAYTLAKTNSGFVTSLYNLMIFIAFWFLGGFAWLDRSIMNMGFAEIANGIIYMCILHIGAKTLSLQVDIYSTLVLEERYGFNKTTAWIFIKDRLKVLAHALVVGAPLLGVVLWFLQTLGKDAWLYGFAVFTLFQLVLFFLMPIVILPLFMDMIPLPGGLALTTEEMDKNEVEKGKVEGTESALMRFLHGRAFYETKAECNGKPCWVTKDRRFKGIQVGAELCIHWAVEKARWAISDGTPDKLGTRHALSETDVSPAEAEEQPLQWLMCKESGAFTDETLIKKIKSTRADTGSLRSSLLELADRTGYKGASIFVIDGSSRRSHSNAFCTGFGQFRRICLFNDLLSMMTEQEIVAIVGREIGHDRLHHVHKMLLIQILHSFVMFYALGKFLQSPVIAEAFFVPEPKLYIGFALFNIVWEVFDVFVSVPMIILQRFNEYDADRFSIECNISYAKELKEALKKLMKRSKPNLTPHWFCAFLTYTHPPPDLRMQAIDEYYQKTWQK